MPCRDYEADYGSSSSSAALAKAVAQNNRLARIACKAMDALVKSGKADFLLLADDEVREWYETHKEADRKAQEANRKAQEAREEKARLAKIKDDVLSRLTDEEKKALGITTKK